jgi:hypothetical protein
LAWGLPDGEEVEGSGFALTAISVEFLRLPDDDVAGLSEKVHTGLLLETASGLEADRPRLEEGK